MRILITGSNGFMGKNMAAVYSALGHVIFPFDKETSINQLDYFLMNCDVIIHLAGVMRPSDSSLFYDVPSELTTHIISFLRQKSLKKIIVLASSTQATLNNDYGKSKLVMERMLTEHTKEIGGSLLIYRFTNSFGKWGKPNYNSVLSTFAFNIAHNLDIYVRDKDFIVNFIYIDDIVDNVLFAINQHLKNEEVTFADVTPVYPVSLGMLSNILYKFKYSLDKNSIPYLLNDFERKLFLTYITYLDYGSLFFDSLDSNAIVKVKEGHNAFYSERDFTVICIDYCKELSLRKNYGEPVFYFDIHKKHLLLPPGYHLEID